MELVAHERLWFESQKRLDAVVGGATHFPVHLLKNTSKMRVILNICCQHLQFLDLHIRNFRNFDVGCSICHESLPVTMPPISSSVIRIQSSFSQSGYLAPAPGTRIKTPRFSSFSLTVIPTRRILASVEGSFAMSGIM